MYVTRDLYNYILLGTHFIEGSYKACDIYQKIY